MHKVLFSMPPGTPPNRVFEAVKAFAREEIGLQHRYAMVLHTNEAHPHVQMVVKAVSEDGVRLNIRKSTLRDWRRQFARHLREKGVEANATERAVRGVSEGRKIDPIFRAERHGGSTRIAAVRAAVAAEVFRGTVAIESGKRRILETRETVELGWHGVTAILERQGKHSAALEVLRFVQQMQPARTERERIAAEQVYAAQYSGKSHQPIR